MLGGTVVGMWGDDGGWDTGVDMVTTVVVIVVGTAVVIAVGTMMVMIVVEI